MDEEWEELPSWRNRGVPTCERCWHAVATWFGGPFSRYVCDKCKPRDQRFADLQSKENDR